MVARRPTYAVRTHIVLRCSQSSVHPAACVSLPIAGSFTHWQKMPMQWRQNGSTGEWYKLVDLLAATHQYKFIIDGQWRHDHTAPTVLDNLGNVNNCIVVLPSQSPVCTGSTPLTGPGVSSSSLSGAEGGGGSSGGGGGCNSGGGGGDGGGGGGGRHGEGGSGGRNAAPTRKQSPLACRVSRVTSDPYTVGSATGMCGDSYSQVVPPRDELLVHHSASLLLPPQLRLLLPHHHGDASTMPLSVQMNHVFCHLHQEYSILAMAHRYRDRSVTQLLYKPNGAVRRQLASHRRIGADASGGTGAELEETSNHSIDGEYRPGTELRAHSKDVSLQSVRISGTQRQREGGHGNEYVTYLVDSVLSVHGVQTTLRSERRYKHFSLLDQVGVPQDQRRCTILPG